MKHGVKNEPLDGLMVGLGQVKKFMALPTTSTRNKGLLRGY